jgi:tetratricopeptide (TPR) repeat protein
MSQIQELLKFDVTVSMDKDIEILLKAINNIEKGKTKEMLEQINKKVIEIEEHFWRPIDSPKVYEQLKAIALEVGDQNKAKTYDSKIKLFQANELEFKGRVQDFYGNKAKAVEFYKEALKLVPDHELALPANEKALKSIDKARSELSKTKDRLETDSDDPKSWFKHGIAHLNLGEVDKAIECLDKTIELDPSNPDAFARRGTAMESLGDYQGAKKYFEKALEIKSSSMIAKRGLNYAEYFLENK